MSVTRAVTRGFGRGLGALSVALWMWLVNLLLAVPASLVVGEALRESIGASKVHEALRRGLDLDWLGELLHDAEGIVSTFRSSLVGPGPILDNLELWFRGELFEQPMLLVATGALFALVWVLLLGGAIDRLARPSGVAGLVGLLPRGLHYFSRLLRLTVLTGVLYYFLYRLSRFLFPWLEERLREVTAESTVLLWNLAVAAFVLLVFALVDMAGDYARIAIVLEERRSSLLALASGAAFVLRSPVKTLAVYLLLSAPAWAVMALWAATAPGAGPATTVNIALAFLAAQLYLVAKIVLRLVLLAGEMTVFEESRRANPGR